MYFYDEDDEDEDEASGGEDLLDDLGDDMEDMGEGDDDSDGDDGNDNDRKDDKKDDKDDKNDDKKDDKKDEKGDEKGDETGENKGDSSETSNESSDPNKAKEGQQGEGQQGQGENLDPDNVRNDMQNASDNLDAQKGKDGQGGQGQQGKDGQGSQGQQGQGQGQSGQGGANSSAQGGSGSPGGSGGPQGGSPGGGAPGGGATPPGGGTPPPAGGAQMGAQAGAQAGAQTGAAAANAGGAAASSGAAAAGGGAAASGGAAAAASGAAASGGAAAAGGGAAVALAYPIAIAAIVILIIIVVVGVVFFFIAMPGQIAEKFKKLGMEFMDKFQALLHGKENVIHTEDLASVANYLESMGYDLKGEGFVSAPKNNGDPNGGTSVANTTYDTEQDVWRDENGQVADLNSDPIMTYIVSDNLCYLIKNFNQNLDKATDGNTGEVLSAGAWILGLVGIVVGIIFSPIAAIITVVAVIAGSALAFATASNPNWGTGLISIWHEGSDIGIRGKAYDVKETGDISLDPATKKLKVKRGWRNNAYTFDVDGWSGRYGMPLEFLLSVHIATQMPDLAIEMSTTFDTDVEVLLRSVEGGKVVAGVLKQWATPGSTNDDDYVTFKQLKDIQSKYGNFLTNLWNGIKKVADWLMFWKKPSESVSLNDAPCYVLFVNGLPHSKNCTCCQHIANHRSVIPSDPDNPPPNACQDCGKSDSITLPTDPKEMENFGKSDLNGHIICSECKERLLAITSALSVVNDNKWESYTPYISKVTNHWFRDVYFVINSSESGDHAADERAGINAVKVDDLYFYETGERWTVYETYSSSDTIPEGFEVGDYKLYEYDASKSNGDGWSNGYKLFTGSKEEVQARKDKISEGDTSVSRLVKKPETDRYTTFNAYESGGSEALPWEKLAVTEDSNTKGELTADAVYADEDASTPDDMIIYYKETRPGDIKQVEDGIRAETNSKIKKMFVNNSYYKYDGSAERADIIMEDRKKYSEDDYKKFNTDDDPRMKNEDTKKLISKVSLTKDSLGAFSILENTHTLDADYIYRDFKELIVELDYFDKEELSDKIQEVMQWVVPDAGSAGWPLRKYEKSEVFYGTLINSKKDLQMMTEADIAAAEGILEETEEEVTPPSTPAPAPAPVPSNISGSITTFVNLGYEIHAEMEGQSPKWDYCVLTDGQSDGHGGTLPQHMSASCSDHKNCGRQHCDTFNSSHTCGLNTSIQDAIANHHNTCCATYVSWVLEEIGYGFQSHGAKDTYNKVKELGFTPITDPNALQPGDLLFNKADYDGTDVNQIGHVQILGNNGEWLNAGSKEAINDAPSVWEPRFIIGMRPTLNGAGQPFKGYEPDQDVVAPVTGKIIEHGKVKRKNVETGKMEDVEFIKIQAMDHCVYDTASSRPIDQGKGYKKAVNSDGTYNEYDPKVQSNLEGYDYFYEEYKGVMDGFVVYIEGFDLTLYDSDGAKALYEGGENTTNVTRYEPNVVYNMTNNTEEAYSLWKEDAKTYAAPIVTINGEEYIKEGTVIGKTLDDPDDSTLSSGDESKPKGNGNYIRIILRDLEDSIVEDVESYFILDDAGFVSTAQPYQAQEGDLELLAALICHEGGAPYWMNCHSFDEQTAMAAAEAVGYVCINRALTNYGGYGKTIKEQINAPGQYAGSDTLESYPYCEKCLEAAEWCLKYDCMSITNPSGESMSREVQGQSGWEQCKSGRSCWWWIDTTEDGERTEAVDTDGDGKVDTWDTFFCRNGSEG